MNKSPINYVLTITLGAVLWVIFAILMGAQLSESPNLAEKDPVVLAGELRLIFGIGVLISIICACYWFYYGAQEKVAGELSRAKTKWRVLFLMQIVFAAALTVVIVVMNMTEGIESRWFGAYFGVLFVLMVVLFWLTTYLMSPRTVKYIPFGR